MIGEKLREVRKNANLTQTQLCDLLNIGRVMYTRYESNKTDPYTTTLRSLCLGLNVSADYLLGLSPMIERANSQGFNLPESFPCDQIDELQRYADALMQRKDLNIQQRMLRAFNMLNERQQELLTELLEGIMNRDDE